MTQKNDSTVKFDKQYIHVAIMLVLCFCGWFLEPFGQITPIGMKVLGVFLGMIYGWIFIGLGWVSMFGFVALAMTGFYNINQVFIAGFGNMIVLQIMVGFIMAGVIEISGLGKVILSRCMRIKGIADHPWLFAGVLMIAVALMSIFAATMAAVFLVWAIIYDIAKLNNAGKDDKFIAFLVGCTVICAYTLMGILPFKVSALSFLAFFERANTGLTIETIPFMGYALVIMSLSMIVLLLIGKFVYRIDASNFKVQPEVLAEIQNVEITSDHKKGIFLIVVLFGCLMAPGVLPDEWAITKLFNTWGLLGVMTIIIALGQLLKNSNGEVYAPFNKIVKSISWDVIMLMAVTFPLSSALESTDSGVLATVQAFVMPYLTNMSPTVFIIVVTIACALVTQVVHNVILGAMFMPTCINLIIAMGGNPIVLWFSMYFALCAAYGTPAASVTAGLIFGHELVPRTEGFKIGFGYMFAVILVISIIGIPLGNLIF